MKSLNTKFITFEKPHFPKIHLERFLKPQLNAFDLNEKPYVLSFQPIKKSESAFYLEVYDRAQYGDWAGHFYGTVHHHSLILKNKEMVPENKMFFDFTKHEKIKLNLKRRSEEDMYGLETKLHGVGMGTILFGLGFKIAAELYGCRAIRVVTRPDKRSFYLKRFSEYGIESIFHPDNRVLLGNW